MGGLVIFTAIGIPYLILSDRDAASLAVFGTALACAGIGFADDWLKIVKARSLGLSARTKLALQLRDRGRPVAGRDAGGRPRATRSSSGSSTARSTSAASTSCWSSSCSPAPPTA